MVKEGADAWAEDDLVVDDDEFFVEEHLGGLAEGLGFEGEAFVFDVVGGVVADVDVEDVLEDDGSFVEDFGDEVGGAAGDAHAAFVGLFVGCGAWEVGEEGGVDVDDFVAEGLDDVWGEDLHVAGEEDEVDLVAGEGVQEPFHVGEFVGGGLPLEGEAGVFDDGFEVGVVGQDADDLAALAPGGLVLDKALEAVGFFADEDGDAFGSSAAVEDDADLHADALAQFEQVGDELVEGDG